MPRQWEVEWCESVPEDEFGDMDIDRAHYVRVSFVVEAQARRYAAEKAAESFWGVATIQRFEEVTRNDIENEIVDHWWTSNGKLYGFVGEREEIEP